MIATAHLVASATITSLAVKYRTPAWTAVAVALSSHVLMDAIPHVEHENLGSDFSTFGTLAFYTAVVDNLIGFAVLLYYYRRLELPRLLTAAVMLGAWAPDLLQYFVIKGWWRGGVASDYSDFHYFLHSWRDLLDPTYTISFGTLNTLVVLFLCILHLRRQGISTREWNIAAT
jgi:hypothetical protein